MPSNQVLQAIRNRRSTRAFLPEQIPDEALHAILDAAIWAPSGSNSQSWLFTAIQSKTVLDRLNEEMRQGFLLRYVPDDDYPAKHGAKKSAQRNEFCFYNHAPTLIIASNRPNYENAMADCALALENMFLAAESLGLGSCYINSPHWLRDDPGVRDYLLTLGIPREHTICSSAAFGFIAKESPALPRKEGTVQIIR
ncbi:MAG: nitroreductase [Christensenellaceae bacterium]|jgi:nitroreductase|nr:nitroreductase [Christensenellaceae bacterium]